MKSERESSDADLRCPTCRAPLKRRRSRTADACEMVCGGCGQAFDVCDARTVEGLRRETPAS